MRVRCENLGLLGLTRGTDFLCYPCEVQEAQISQVGDYRPQNSPTAFSPGWEATASSTSRPLFNLFCSNWKMIFVCFTSAHYHTITSIFPFLRIKNEAPNNYIFVIIILLNYLLSMPMALGNIFSLFFSSSSASGFHKIAAKGLL